MLKCVRHRDIRFPIDRATKHMCRAELFFAADIFVSLIKRTIMVLTGDHFFLLAAPFRWSSISLSFSPSKRVPLWPHLKIRASHRFHEKCCWPGRSDLLEQGLQSCTPRRNTRKHSSLRNAYVHSCSRIKFVTIMHRTQSYDHDPTWMNTVK